MRISDWSSDVCSSDLVALRLGQTAEGFGQAALHFLDLLVQFGDQVGLALVGVGIEEARVLAERAHPFGDAALRHTLRLENRVGARGERRHAVEPALRSEEPTSELKSLMRNPYAVLCLKKKKHTPITQ